MVTNVPSNLTVPLVPLAVISVMRLEPSHASPLPRVESQIREVQVRRNVHAETFRSGKRPGPRR